MPLCLIFNESTDNTQAEAAAKFQYEITAVDMKKEKLHTDFPEIYKKSDSKFVISLLVSEVGSPSNGAKYLYDYFKQNEFRNIRIKYVKHFAKVTKQNEQSY